MPLEGLHRIIIEFSEENGREMTDVLFSWLSLEPSLLLGLGEVVELEFLEYMHMPTVFKEKISS